jgi:hypothetical protein
MLHEMMVENYQWLSFGVNVYVNVTWDVGKISMALFWSKCLCKCYMRCVRKTSMALFWSKCLCKCYMRCVGKISILSLGVNIYVNVTWDVGKISMDLFWSKYLCNCYMRWWKNINDSLLE